jgi:hypothetical protein
VKFYFPDNFAKALLTLARSFSRAGEGLCATPESGYASHVIAELFQEESDPNGIRTHFEVFAALRNSALNMR